MDDNTRLVVDLKRVSNYARRNKKENHEFRIWVKVDLKLSDQKLDALVHQIARDVSDRVDCTACGNCCRPMLVAVDNDDIALLAKSQKISFMAFERRAVMRAEDGEKCLIRTPCDFLSGNMCTVYEYRPKACRDFPYLHHPEFRKRMLTAIDNTEVCPIAYNTIELLKRELKFPRKT